MPERSAFRFHDTFYPKPRIDLEAADRSKEMQEKLQILKQNYDYIVCKHISDIGLTHLEEKTIETNPELPPVASKPYP